MFKFELTLRDDSRWYLTTKGTDLLLASDLSDLTYLVAECVKNDLKEMQRIPSLIKDTRSCPTN